MTCALLLLSLLAQAQEQPAPAQQAEQEADEETEQEAEQEANLYKAPAEIQAALSEALKDPEFRRLAPKETKKKEESKDPSRLERLLDRIFGGKKEAQKESPSPSFSVFSLALVQILTWVLYGIVALAFAFVVFWIVKGILGRDERAKLLDKKGRPGTAEAVMPSTPPGEQPAEEYLREALRLGQAGKHREAIRQLLLGTMSWIERNDLIRFRKGLTNRDYLRAVWHQPKRRDPMQGLIFVFDQVYFGRRAANAERFQECLGYYRSGFSSP